MNDDKADLPARLRAASHHALMDAARPLVCQAADEIERLREAIRRLADQDATLSVCDGSVTVTMDATLTDKEREAVGWALRMAKAFPEFESTKSCAAALSGLLERLG